EHDYDLVMEALLDTQLINENTMDLKSFRRDLIDTSEPFYGRSLKTVSIKEVYDQVILLVYKYKIHLPRNLLLLFKTLIQTEALGKILGSDASLLEVTKPYAKELLKRTYMSKSILRNIRKDTLAIGDHMKVMPKLVHDILDQTAKGKQRIELRHTGFQKINTHLVKSINRLIIGIVISASLIAGAMVLNAPQHVSSMTVTLFGFEKVPLTAVLGLTGYIIATFLAIWLIIMILRSGKL
ncbi:MAG: AarF/ABC1/UbiB kinase family protein, partial [Desulfobacterales bacterium]